MKTEIANRISALRKEMEVCGVDAYVVPTEDFHTSEYVGAYFKSREFITGFTGSAGTAVIMKDQAGLWTDGRYFIQAADQLSGTPVTLYKMGEPEVPTLHEFLKNELKDGQTLGFDGRTVGAQEAEALRSLLAEKHISFKTSLDLVGNVWEGRPELSAEPVMELDVKWCGETRASKLQRVREVMKEKGADSFLLSSLDDIAWLLNLRGGDIPCNPVFLSYVWMDEEKVTLFASEKAFSDEVKAALCEDGVVIAPYDSVYDAVAGGKEGSTILLSKSRVNSRLVDAIPSNVNVIDAENPTTLFKAIKNETEANNEIIAHIKDGVAVTKFMYWLKKTVGKETITEISAAEKLLEFRKEQENFLEESFNPIISYGAHGAIVHYSATPETDIPVEPRSLLLCDTGGQYMEGTTDITRTIAMGETTQEEKEMFTAVLRGHINLADAVFRYGCTGINLDYLAREPLWKMGKDYNHGTGHGVGYLLNVHEGPNGFRWKTVPERKDCTVFEEGMITSDEPGYYEENKFGIRHESLLLCKKAFKTEVGQFMKFEELTMVPFDLDAILPEQMQEKERELLNKYHKTVYEKISPYLSEEEREWLAEATREI